MFNYLTTFYIVIIGILVSLILFFSMGLFFVKSYKKVSKFKNNLFFSILILIILMLGLPFFPYKIQRNINSNKYTKIKVDFPNTGITILEGNEELKKIRWNLGFKNVPNTEVDNIGLSGKIPYNELTTYMDGIAPPLYLYGKFESVSEGAATFNIYEWYPADNSYVKLLDTYIWKKIFTKIYKAIAMLLSGLLILAFIFKLFTLLRSKIHYL